MKIKHSRNQFLLMKRKFCYLILLFTVCLQANLVFGQSCDDPNAVLNLRSCDDENPCTVNDFELVLAPDDIIVCQPCTGIPITCSTNGSTSIQACNDGDACTINDEETILNCDGSICVPCAGVPIDCTSGSTSIQACNDGDACTINDEETVLDCDGSVCVPCAGIPADCNNGAATSIQACDDGNVCTMDDEEIILDCDGSVCVPCAGIIIPCCGNGLTITLNTITQISCPDETGGISVTVSGGAAPYTYEWFNSTNISIPSANNPIIDDLISGIYTLEVTDNNGCTVKETYIISPYSGDLMDIVILATGPFCFNPGDPEEVSVLVYDKNFNYSTGAPNYTYDWSPTTPTPNGAEFLLDNDTIYTVTVTDHSTPNLCESTAQITIKVGLCDPNGNGNGSGSCDISIAGTVYSDDDNNQIFSSGDGIQVDWRINLEYMDLSSCSPSPCVDYNLNAWTTSKSDGTYELKNNFIWGTYLLSEVVESDWRPLFPSSGRQTIVIGGCQNITGADFLNEEIYCINDYEILTALYNATDGANWSPINWDLTESVSGWAGVTLNAQGCVIGLELPNNNLSGELPNELCELVNLLTLDLSNNSLTGCFEQCFNVFCQPFNADFSGNPNSADFIHLCDTDELLVDAGSNDTINLGESVTLSPIIVGGNHTCSWSPTTDLDNANDCVTNFTPTVEGVYWYTITVTDACNNIVQDAISITVEEACSTIPSIDIDDLVNCPESDFTLTATSDTGVSWVWSGQGISAPDNTGQSIDVQVNIAGTYTYTVTVSDNLGCTNTATIDVDVNLPIDAGSDVTINLGDDTQLQASSGFVSYEWTPSTALSDSTIANPIANPSTSTIYMVTGTYANGCTFTDIVVVYVAGDPVDNGCTGTQNNMSILANICLNGAPFTELDTFDIIYAHLNGQTTANPIAVYPVDSSLVAIITICADSSEVDDPITFTFQNNTPPNTTSGVLYTIQETIPYNPDFAPNCESGTCEISKLNIIFNAPIFLINTGFNWFSLPVIPVDGDLSLNAIFSTPQLNPSSSYSPDNGDLIKSQNDGFAQYIDGFGWFGTLNEIDPAKMYKLYTESSGGTFEIKGTLVPPSPQNLVTEWNWIGPTSVDVESLDDALSSLPLVSGDLIKSQADGFAQYFDGSGWFGVLSQLAPTKGYKINLENDGVLSPFSNCNLTGFSNNMTVTANVLDSNNNDVGCGTCIIKAYVNGECRGEIPMLDDGSSFLSWGQVQGNQEDANNPVNFIFVDQNGQEYEIIEIPALNYSSSLGSFNAPFLFHINNTVLPIELIAFDAILLKENQVQLKWSTASEQNNSHFELERSTDGKIWSIISKINRISSNSHQYEFIDNCPYMGTIYYRLRQVDFDETATYSKTKVVIIEEQHHEFIVYPNPVKEEVTFVLFMDKQETFEVSINDIFGKTVFSETMTLQQGLNEKVLLLNQLPKGSYLIKVSNDESFYIKKILKI